MVVEAASLGGKPEIGSLILRITTVLFFLMWALDTIIAPDHTLRAQTSRCATRLAE